MLYIDDVVTKRCSKASSEGIYYFDLSMHLSLLAEAVLLGVRRLVYARINIDPWVDERRIVFSKNKINQKRSKKEKIVSLERELIKIEAEDYD